MERALTVALAIVVAGCAGCARIPSMRTLDAIVHVSYRPSGQDLTATLSLAARPSPPPIFPRDATLFEPTIPPSRVDRCRSVHDLCRYEAAEIAYALAALGVAP